MTRLLGRSVLVLCVVLCFAFAAASADEVSVSVRPWMKEGTWAFTPGDRLEGGLLDLRTLNEGTAGESGLVRLSEDGNGFVLGDGRPVRFWGVAARVNEKVSDEDLARHARFLARMGVNMVRVGGASSGLIPQEEGSEITDVNEQFVKDVWRTVAAMKKEGIYTRVAPFWDHGSVKYINENWGIEGYSSGDRVNALLFFEPTLQKGYRAWMRKLLTEENPYTGIPLKDDPALAIVQIVSEDTLLFWWVNSIKGGPLRELQGLFGEFAAERYGSFDKAYEAWDGARAQGDAPEEGRLGLYNLHELIEWPPRKNRQRLNDQTEFLARLEREFYADMKRYLQDDLGARQIIGPSNFHAADDVRLNDVQRWAWTAGDVIELNDFFSGGIKGPQSFWRIQAGHRFVPRSATLHPELPPAKKQVVGRPFIVSSTNWVPPNPYATEGPILSAAYAAMNGLDGILWFAAQDATYDTDPYMSWWTIKGSHPMPRWSISEPGFMSQFPAAALIMRRGLVTPAETVIHEERTQEEMFERRPPLMAESAGYQPAEHAEEALPVKQDLMEKASPDAFLAGRVEVVYDGDPVESRVMDLSDLVDEEAGEVWTTHGQLALNRKKGLLRIDAPAAQGVVGFLADAGGSFELSDVRIQTENDYGTIVAVSLDDEPLARSRRVLLQVGTIIRPTGWETRPADVTRKGQTQKGVEILSTGKMPWRVVKLDAKLTIANRALTTATRLDETGFADGEVPVKPTDDGVSLDLPADALYVVLSAE